MGIFLVCINDLYDYASLFSVVHDIDTSTNDLNHDLEKISKRSFQWKMNFNLQQVKKNSGPNSLPLSSMLLVVKTCAIFDFFPFPCFHNIDLGGEGGFKVFAFDILKVALVVPLHFLTDCLKIMGGKSSNLKNPNFFFPN